MQAQKNKWRNRERKNEVANTEESSLDVGCGFLTTHKKQGMIGMDLRRGLCDVIGDAEQMPFRDAVFDKVYLRSILEHLDAPLKCLKESLRVAKDGACFEILIPVDARYPPIFLRLVLEFPFSIPYVLSVLMRIYRYGKLKGSLHINRIQPRHITPFFTKAVVIKKRTLHSWCFFLTLGRKGRISNKLIFRNRKIYGKTGIWVIKAKN